GRRAHLGPRALAGRRGAGGRALDAPRADTRPRTVHRSLWTRAAGPRRGGLADEPLRAGAAAGAWLSLRLGYPRHRPLPPGARSGSRHGPAAAHHAANTG